ncbi:MAG TPA: histidine kinase N-terminal 7TM domain-containing protein [Anaerolineales bacterium]|nr:histidine kinase N-terminal 7TM domain-containing protein [Anaerolineales bacterium]
MNREEFLYLAPDLFSLLLLVGLFWYAWRHRYIRGARTYSWLIAGQILTVIGFVFELISPDLETKIFWDTFQWLTTAFLVILPFLVFAVQISEQKLAFRSFTWGIILTFLGIFATLSLTDNLHHLFYQNPRLITDYPFSKLSYDLRL